MKSVSIFLFLCIWLSFKAQISANFNIPDTVCVNQTFTVQNTTTGSPSTYYWSFCQGNTNVTPAAINLGNIGLFNGPVYYTIGKDGANYYAFVSNNWGGTVSRLFYGSSLLNTPVATNLGNFGGAITISIEDMYLEKQGGNWYGIMVGCTGGGGRIVRLDFGSSLANTPTATNMGNIGGLNYPQRLQIFSSGGNYYGFTPNLFGNSITRFNFGTSLGNTPTGVNLGNIGSLNQPDDIAIINYGGNWYGYIVNEISNTLTRLDFGNSLLNTPTGTNLGNTGALNGPRGIDVYVECGEIRGLITNRYGNDLLKMNFTSGPTGPIVTTSFGNIANFSFPHSIERFRVGDTLFAMIPNVSNSTLSRIYYPGCTNSSISSSTLAVPPAISYNQPGQYYINLTVDETLISQSSYCKQITVVPSPTANISGANNFCIGDTIRLFANAPAGSAYQWQGPNGFSSTNSTITIPNANINNAGTYSLVVQKNACTSGVITKSVIINPATSVNLGNDTLLCSSSFSLNLNAFCSGCSYLWSNGQTTSSITISSSGQYSIKLTNSFGCISKDTINVTNSGLNISISTNTLLCNGNSITLDVGLPGSTYLWSNGLTTQTIMVNTPGQYSVSVLNSLGCMGKDSVLVLDYTPNSSLGNDKIICSGTSYVLNAGSSDNIYLWSNGLTTPSISVNTTGLYFVDISNNGCHTYDTVNVLVNPVPIVNLGNDTSFCTGNSISMFLDAGNAGAIFSWTGGATTQTLFVNSAGVFSVQVIDANGCLSTDSVSISLANLSLNLGNDTILCEGTKLTLNAKNTGATYLWNNGATTQTISASSSGNYWVQIMENGCEVVDTITLNFYPKPIVNLGSDITICPGDQIILNVGTGYNYFWNNGSSSFSLSVNLPGTYSVVVSNFGCSSSDQIVIKECESEIWVPNSFSPNGDGVNDYFSAVYLNINKIKMLVFDRWGEEIFNGEQENAFWDGTYKGSLCEIGVYVYIIEYEHRSDFPKMKRLVGHINLIK